jgi:acid stress-induced BolA-like protein IbaG/YrbA
MTEEEIRALLLHAMPGSEITVGGDGYHIDIEVVSDAFAGQSRVRRQQLVYAALGDAIRSGAIHAVNIKTATRAERAAAGSQA